MSGLVSLPDEDVIVSWYYPILLIFFSISTINLYKCKHKSRVLDFMTVKKKKKIDKTNPHVLAVNRKANVPLPLLTGCSASRGW